MTTPFGRMYGKMDVNAQPTAENLAPMVACSKCGGPFSSAKKHHEININSFMYVATGPNSVNPAPREAEGYYRLCNTCFDKFKTWVGTK